MLAELRPKIRIFKEPPQYLFPRRPNSKIDHDLYDPVFRYKHGVSVWLRETLKRRRNIPDIIDSVRGENIFEHVIEGFDFAHSMDIADRAANGLRVNLVFDNRKLQERGHSQFGMMINYGYNNPKLAEHGHPHLRRVERLVEAMLLNIGDLRHSETVKQFIDALLLYTNFHDMAQIRNLQHNLLHSNDQITNVKKAHGLEAAIMLLVMHRRYASERKIGHGEAWQKCAQAAAMIMLHDNPEKFLRVLNSRENAFEVYGNNLGEYKKSAMQKKIGKLANVFRESQPKAVVDVFSLTPRQLLLILAHLKQADFNTFGLPADFVKEYKVEISNLFNNQSPLLEYEDVDEKGRQVMRIGMPEEGRQAFNLAAEVALMGDLIDMRIPGQESILRTFRAQRSQKRNFFPYEFHLENAKKNIFSGSGELRKGDPLSSDVIRILWESTNIEKIIKDLPEDNPLLKSNYLKRIIKDASIMSVLSLQEIGSALMTGDFSIIYRIYGLRRANLVHKAEDRLKIKLANLSMDELTEAANHLNNDVAIRLLEEINNLDIEEQEIISNLKIKFSKVYSKNDIDNFLTLTDLVLEELYKRYKITGKEKKKYLAMSRQHRMPNSVPYQGYESIGIYPPKTLVEPIGLMALAAMKIALDEQEEE